MHMSSLHLIISLSFCSFSYNQLKLSVNDVLDTKEQTVRVKKLLAQKERAPRY